LDRTKRKIIRNTNPDSFDIEGNNDLFDKIVADQEKYASKLRPEKNWGLEIGGHGGGEYFYSKQKGEVIEFDSYSNNSFDENFSSLQKMLDPLVGCTGLKNINNDVVQDYYTFLKGVDHLDILPYYFEPNGKIKSQANHLKITDLGSIIDINIINSFLDPRLEKYNILEVGGGYGRLAEVFFRLNTKGNIKYVLLDAVPASLMYSYLYLSKNLPDLRIGFYYRDDPFNMDLFDSYIMPSWHFNISKCVGTFDCCINIQSMQEMNQYHVDFYLNLFDQILKDDSGIAYISNEKDYIFQGEWNYPKNWNCLLKTRTPRSWTRNSPTEVFIKGSDSIKRQNCLVDLFYSLQLKEFDINIDQLKIISNLQLEVQQNHQELSDLRSTLSMLPFISEEEPTIEKVEKSIQVLNEYYRSKDLPDVIRLFENINKANAHLLAASIYLREGQLRQTFSHLLIVGKLDLPILFSIQTLKIIWNSLLIRLKRT